MRRAWAVAKVAAIYLALIGVAAVYAVAARTDGPSERRFDLLIVAIAALPLVLLPAALLVRLVRRR